MSAPPWLEGDEGRGDAVMVAMNLALRFLLELAALAALGYWGAGVGTIPFTRIAWAIAAPLTAAIVWGIWVAPKSRWHLEPPGRIVPELLVFGAAAAALYFAGRPRIAAVYAALVLLSEVLLYTIGRGRSG
jgi:hypothetical protein